MATSTIQELKNLPKDALVTLKDTCTSAKGYLTTQKLAIQAAVANMEIELIPLKAKAQALQVAVDGVRSVANIVPQSVTSAIPETAALNPKVQNAIDPALEFLEDTLLETNRLIALQQQKRAEEAKIDTDIKYFDDLSKKIDEALAVQS